MSASETLRNDTPGVIAPSPLVFAGFLLAGIAIDPLGRAERLACAGVALAMDSIAALALLVPAVLVIPHGVILREERYLESKFRGEYLRYEARVRPWL